jgi:hypothetical protein
MKFKLVEDAELLLEKKWVQLSATRNGKPEGKPFYFYAIDGTSSINDVDIKELLPYVTGSGRKGTYKQQLNPTIVSFLRDMYKNCKQTGDTFDLVITNHSVNPKHVKQHNCLTLTDADLRRVARDTVSKNSSFPLEDIDEKEYLIHHKVKGEKNNSFNNIALISRCEGDPLAHAIHKVIENNPLSSAPLKFVVPIYEFDTSHSSKGWKVTHTATLNIV